jgi:hypothetical protein
MKILFHVNVVKVDLHESDAVIPADFAQFVCARQIYHTSLLDEPHRNNLFRFIIGTGKTLEGVFILTFWPNAEFCEFLVQVNFNNYSFLFFVSKFSLSHIWKPGSLKVCLKSSSAVDTGHLAEDGQISPEQNLLAWLMVYMRMRKITATHSTICGTRKLRFVLN